MRHRVMDVLLVCSPYDLFVLEEAGQLAERVLGEFRNLDLHYGPGLTGVSSGAEALALVRAQSRFNLIITTLDPGDMDARELAAQVTKAGLDIPVVGLAFDVQELDRFVARGGLSGLHRVFLWEGDARILLAIVKDVEDRRNVAHDTAQVGVQVILLVEDNVRDYSSFLPTLYAELLQQSQRLLAEGANLSHKILRMRARPKLLLSHTFEQAWADFEEYRDDILGVISDVELPWGATRSATAGLELARRVRAPCPDVPVLLQSARPENADAAHALGVDFLRKGSALLLHDLRRFLADFGFGDFIFRMPDGREVGRATDLKTLEECLRSVPGESVAYHAERNHFSKWLKARTEFALAHELRPQRPSDFPSAEELRAALTSAIAAYRTQRSLATVADFDRSSRDFTFDFQRIGGGSLGGKARGMAFVRRLLSDENVTEGLPGVRVSVPPCVVLATDVFDRFLEDNALRDFALSTDDDAQMCARFLDATFPEDARGDLATWIARIRHPLAVRSSSLLEDAQYQPFTGVYDTVMLTNLEGDDEERLQRLLRAVKLVWASTFSRQAKEYIRATPYRLEEEKMAVAVQWVVGARHGPRFYPDVSGVARSHNFYPTAPLTAEDGVAAVALGLGRTVVEGGNALRFSPRWPRHLVQFSSVGDVRRNSQRTFWALDLRHPGAGDLTTEALFDLEAAEADGTLGAVASTWSPENDAIYDGLARPGVRLVSFAPILKHGAFPLAELLARLLRLGTWGIRGPVEIEFAVNLSVPSGEPAELGVLQIRPLALTQEREELELGDVDPARVVCRSPRVLGHGRLELRDVVVVCPERLDRTRSVATAQDLAQMNALLSGTPYLLVGSGRWGSTDPWLGIPVAWEQVAGARVIVEAGLRDAPVQPSQGTHFFHNLTSFNVGYFTVNPEVGEGTLDWEWLARQEAVRTLGVVRHVRVEHPLTVVMDGRRGQGVILRAE